MNTSRRSLLLGGASGLSVLAVGGLAACSSGAGSQSSRSTAPPASGGATSSGGASGTPAAAGSGTPASGGGMPAGALTSTAEVPVGGGKILTAERMVITQPAAGEFVGLSGICTHQGCMVSQVRGASIICGCHGSQFGLDGAVQKGPAKMPLEKIAVSVQGDGIVKG